MALDALSFIRNRSDVVSITNERIKHILWYVVECYHLLKSDVPIYSKDWIRKNTSHKIEDYLKMELVEKYLIPNKGILKSRISSLDEINFNYEAQKRYTDISDKKEKVDKIDIYINKLGLKQEWNEPDENVYFSIECKRITILSDTNEYILDIQKYTQRHHTDLRLPYEGMLAFIENSRLTHTDVSLEISNRLNKTASIATKQNLCPSVIHSGFHGSYSSIHVKNFGANTIFSVYHLLLDYSNIVVD